MGWACSVFFFFFGFFFFSSRRRHTRYIGDWSSDVCSSDLEEQKIIRAFEKDWNEIKSYDSWVIFKVMSEFVEGFEKLAKIGPCVSIFGSARTKPDQK